MITVTKSFDFAYAHKLYDYDGLCKNLHGHRGVLEVEVGYGYGIIKRLFPNTMNGMVVDFKDLKNIVKEKVIDKFDHAYLNDVMNDDNPTAERMVEWIKNELEKVFSAALIRIRVYETPTSYAEWRR